MPDELQIPKYCVGKHAVHDLVKVSANKTVSLGSRPLRNPHNPEEWYGLQAAAGVSICGFGSCTYRDVNAWFDATAEWMDGDFKFLVEKFQRAVSTKQSGAMSSEQKDALEGALKLWKEWSVYRSSFRKWTARAQFSIRFPHAVAREEIFKITDFWNRGACAAEKLERNLPKGVERQTGSETGAPPAPPPPPNNSCSSWLPWLCEEGQPSGGQSGGQGGKQSGGQGGRSRAGKFVAGAAIVGGGFLLYKVLTE